MIETTCSTIEDCLNAILVVISTPDQPNFSDWAPAAAAVLVAIAAVVVSVVIAGIDQRRVLTAERQALRESLRLWFAGLSGNAKKEVRRGHRALDSRIKEDIGPLGRSEIRKLMEWASLVHESSRELERGDSTRKDEMHARRMYAKWIFRDLLAEWALRPLRTRVKINRLTRQGYGVVANIAITDPKEIAKRDRPFDPQK